MEVGEVVTAKRVLTQRDFDRFAELSGDDNPIHDDPEFAAKTRVGATVSHGMLLHGPTAATLSNREPTQRSAGAVQAEQDTAIVSPQRRGYRDRVRSVAQGCEHGDRPSRPLGERVTPVRGGRG